MVIRILDSYDQYQPGPSPRRTLLKSCSYRGGRWDFDAATFEVPPRTHPRSAPLGVAESGSLSPYLLRAMLRRPAVGLPLRRGVLPEQFISQALVLFWGDLAA